MIEPAYRTCPITHRTVIIAPTRALRPITMTAAEPVHRSIVDGREICPFCPGMEHDTPHECYAIRAPGTAPDTPGWTLRVVPNKYPAVSPNCNQGYGIHDCIIDSPRHVTAPTELTLDELKNVIVAWRARMQVFAGDTRLVHATPFKNVGAEAGASLAHSHSQLIALPFVPDQIVAEMAGAKRTYEETGTCPIAAMITTETRRVAQTQNYVAVCPFAPRFGYETWIIPKSAELWFEQFPLEQAEELAGLLQSLLQTIDSTLNRPAYNVIIHSAPFGQQPLPYYRWHVEIIPRTARAAGFEWGSGVFINAISPERAADELRDRMTI